jgi:NADPH:quinone reductase
MKALLSEEPGGPTTLVLREVEKPAPNAGEVRIAVHACGVNFPDSLVIEDRYQLRPPRPFSPGSELAGVVDVVGAGVSELTPGRRVLASLPFGAMAEFVCVPAIRCVPIPDEMPFEEAAAFQVTYGTVYYALRTRGRLRAGEILLVLGAGGGIGLAAVELGKALGARVIAAASSIPKLALARDAGADAVLNYARDALSRDEARAFSKAVREASGQDGIDVVLDPIGGAYAELALRTLSWGGRHLVVGFAAGIPSIPLNLTLLKGCEVVGVFWGAYMARSPEAGARDMAALLSFYTAGLIRPRISERFPLERGGEAIARLADRRAEGKLVVRVRDG